MKRTLLRMMPSNLAWNHFMASSLVSLCCLPILDCARSKGEPAGLRPRTRFCRERTVSYSRNARAPCTGGAWQRGTQRARGQRRSPSLRRQRKFRKFRVIPRAPLWARICGVARP